MYVSNAKHTSYYYQRALGFELIAFGDDSSGLKGKLSYILKQNQIYLIITSITDSNSPYNKFTSIHGDFVKNIAFIAKGDIDKCYEKFVASKVRIIKPKQRKSFFEKEVTTYIIQGYEHLEHSIYSDNLSEEELLLLNGYTRTKNNIKKSGSCLLKIDHIAFCLPYGGLEKIASYYKHYFDFHESRHEYIYSDNELSGMRTLVIESENKMVKFPLVEPINNDSPLNIFLSYYKKGGVHHVAYSTNDIVNAVRITSLEGVEYLQAPDTYYLKRSKNHDISNLNILRQYNILVEQNASGSLKQIFSMPLQPFPTFFFELIERKNNEGFGSGNIKALYDSINLEKQKYASIK